MTYQLISTVTLTAAASSIEFTAIPQDGVDLLLVVSARNSFAAVQSETLLRLNNDTGGNYGFVSLRGDGSSVIASSSAGNPFIALDIPGSTSTANTFGNFSLYISNYTSTTNKSLSIDNVLENNATAARSFIMAHSYSTSSAISSIQYVITGGNNFVSGTTASLYKIS